MADQPDAGHIEGIPHRIRIPAGSGPHPALIMLHGYKGAETVTWIFARAAGPEWLIASPRAPFAAGASPEDGYTWWLLDEVEHITPDSYQAGLEALEKYLQIGRAHV